MVWGGVSAEGKTQLVIVEGNLNAQGYIIQIIEPVLVPFAQGYGDDFLLMDDNARPHRANVVSRYLQDRTGVEQYPSKAHPSVCAEHAASMSSLD